MMDFQTLLALATFSIVGSISPGPNNLMLMASGTNFGFRRTLPHMLGVTIGFYVMMLIMGSGVGLAVQANATFALVLKITSAVYLVYLAWKIASAPVDLGAVTSGDAKPITFLQAVAFQWVNPKAWSLGLTAFAVYLQPDSGWQGVVLTATVFSLVGAPASLIWTVAGVQLRRLLDRPKALRAFNVSAALLLVGSLAVTL